MKIIFLEGLEQYISPRECMMS